VLAAPLARPLGIRVLLWFTHWKPTRKATVAEKLSSAVVSVDRRSFPLESRKVIGIGHGIDLEEFACRGDGRQANDFRAVVLARADVLINNMRAGAPDKVVYEAAASCVPVLASNPVFDDLLDDSLRFDRDDPADLATRLRALAGLPEEERDQLGRKLRERVAEHHSVDHWAERVLELVP